MNKIWLADKSQFDLSDLDSNVFNQVPLIVAASKMNRYNGNVPHDLKPYGYSVLEHMLNCSSYVKIHGLSEYMQLLMLLHDLGEPLSSDFTRATKAVLSCGEELDIWEKKCQAWVYRGFGINVSPIDQAIVDRIDDLVMELEIGHFYHKPLTLTQATDKGVPQLFFGDSGGQLTSQYCKQLNALLIHPNLHIEGDDGVRRLAMLWA